ncbi:MAG: monooxygenase [Streptosporangiaceae bacterium]|jgi:alkanesulfonate monooxygenase SsuD/methylene tetrahydromethanopterin reductase-like flavin-dependent oxidoreductase (luciferase family)|nr:monooxygenase [Streptosporangiaceae bacterium]
MHFGLKPPSQFIGINDLREVWTLADEGGFDGCWVFDHFTALGPDPAGDVFEGWSLLAAMAQATRQVRIGCLVTGNTYRHPGVLAKMAATIDHLSGGRLEVGLGAGGHHTDLGLPTAPPRDLLGRFDEACQILKLLWTEPTVTFVGEHHRLDQTLANPKPVQRPHPPLWLGSSGERGGLRVVAKYADVWINASPFGTGVEELTRLSRIVDGHCAQLGRDPATVRRAVQIGLPDGEDEALRLVETFAQAGFTEIILALRARGGAAVAAAETAVKLLPRLRAMEPR